MKITPITPNDKLAIILIESFCLKKITDNKIVKIGNIPFKTDITPLSKVFAALTNNSVGIAVLIKPNNTFFHIEDLIKIFFFFAIMQNKYKNIKPIKFLINTIL